MKLYIQTSLSFPASHESWILDHCFHNGYTAGAPLEKLILYIKLPEVDMISLN